MRLRIANVVVVVVTVLLACPIAAGAAEALVGRFESLGRYGEPTPLAINKSGKIVGQAMSKAVRFDAAASRRGS